MLTVPVIVPPLLALRDPLPIYLPLDCLGLDACPTHHPVPESGKWLVVFQYKRLIPCMTNVLDVHSHTFPFAQYVITVNLVFSILVRKNQEPTDIALSHSR